MRSGYPQIVIGSVLGIVFATTLTGGPADLKPSRSPDTPKLLTAEQQAKLKECDRLKVKIGNLRKEENLAEAIAICDKLLAIERDVLGEAHDDVSVSRRLLAAMHEESGNWQTARKVREVALEVQIHAYGDGDWRVDEARWALKDLEFRRNLPAEQQRRLTEANRFVEQAADLERQNQLAHAATAVGQALNHRRDVLGPEHPALAECLNRLGVLHARQGHFDSAQAHFEAALAIWKMQNPNAHPDMARSLTNLGNVFNAIGDDDRALNCYRESLTLNQKLYPADRYPAGHRDLAAILNNIAIGFTTQGDFGRAYEHHEQALRMLQKLYPAERYPDGHPDVATSLNGTGQVLLSQGEDCRALEYFQQALRMWRALYPADRYPSGHPYLASALDNLGFVFRCRWEYGRALNYFHQAQAMRERLYPADRYSKGHPDLADSLINLGNVFGDQGDYGHALSCFQQALAMYQHLYPIDRYPNGHPDLANQWRCVLMNYVFPQRHRILIAIFQSRGYPSRNPDLFQRP